MVLSWNQAKNAALAMTVVLVFANQMMTQHQHSLVMETQSQRENDAARSRQVQDSLQSRLSDLSLQVRRHEEHIRRLSDASKNSETISAVGEADECVSWRTTGGCDPKGLREPDLDRPCSAAIAEGVSGFCECRWGNTAAVRCNHHPFTCADRCQKGVAHLPLEKEAEVRAIFVLPPPTVTAAPPPSAGGVPRAEMPLRDESGCYTRRRVFDENPILVANGDAPGEIPCDVPCQFTSSSNQADTFLNSGPSGPSCPYKTWASFTMENSPRSHGAGNSFMGTTRLESDIPLMYASWPEYRFMDPPVKKTADSLMAVLISNCGNTKRLTLIENLGRHNISYDSFGRCLHNKDAPEADRNAGNYKDGRSAIARLYKFTASMENSETDDYVTEKLFSSLEAGTIPVYMGAPNGHIYAPSNKSVLFTNDFATPQLLAQRMQELANDEAKYNEYLAWKTEGPSDEWLGVINLSVVHSNCRLCIRAADYIRKVMGEPESTPIGLRSQPSTLIDPEIPGTPLRIRARGYYWFHLVHLPNEAALPFSSGARQFLLEELSFVLSREFDELRDFLAKWTNNNPLVFRRRVLYVFRAADQRRQRIDSDEELWALPPHTELEAVLI